MRKYFVVIVLFFCHIASHNLCAQQDSVIISEHKYIKAAGAVISFNTLLNRVNRFVLPSGKEWAHVNWESWKNNLSQGPSWDWDYFTTNWFAHPYSGAMYYLSARNVGMKPLAASAHTVYGTMMWEYLGETLPPSTNDFFTNILGGNHLGEVFYRLSQNLIKQKSSGLKRLGKESLNFVVNPVGELELLLFNDTRRVMTQDIEKYNITHKLSIGSNMSLSVPDGYSKKVMPYVELDINYGNINSNESTFQYFDIFDLKVYLRFDNSQGAMLPFWNLRSDAILYGKVLNGQQRSKHLLGIFQHYDYMKAESYELGSFAVSVGHMYQYMSDKWTIATDINIGGIALGAGDSETVQWIKPEDEISDQRDYVMGPGYILKGGVSISNRQLGKLSAEYSKWYIQVLSGPSGSEHVDYAEVSYSYPISRKVELAIGHTLYNRHGSYHLDSRSYDEKETLSELKVLLQIRL